MTKLTKAEKEYNAWWMSRFDADKYKIIRLFDHGRLIKRYTTANARFTDMEDAESAFWVAEQGDMSVTAVAVGDKRYKKSNGRIQRIANLGGAR